MIERQAGGLGGDGSPAVVIGPNLVKLRLAIPVITEREDGSGMVVDGFEVIFLAESLTTPDEARTLRGLIDRLKAEGHCCRVICRAAGFDHGIENLLESPGLGRRWQLPWASRGLDLGPKSRRPRILHVLGVRMAEPGLEIAERWGLPYLLGIDEFPRRDLRLRVSRTWCRGLIAENHELAGSLTLDFGIPERMVHQVRRGISGLDELPSYSGPKRVPVVGASGPLVAGSGFTTFLNAARKLVDAGIDAEFLIAGEGEDEAELRRRADRLRISDRLTFADEPAIGLSFWDALNVFCQPSVVPTTGRPLALAMSHGVPSVASDVQGLGSLVSDRETGLRIPSGDASGLARAIGELLDDRELAGRLGQAGRVAVLRDHHPDLEACRLLGLYRGILEHRSPGLDRRSQEAALESSRVPGWVGAVPRVGPEA